jgi:hypothetical protein
MGKLGTIDSDGSDVQDVFTGTDQGGEGAAEARRGAFLTFLSASASAVDMTYNHRHSSTRQHVLATPTSPPLISIDTSPLRAETPSWELCSCRD